MRKICWLLIITLLLGCLAACQSKTGDVQPTEPPPIENEDGTLAQWMKTEINAHLFSGYYEAYGVYPKWFDEGDRQGLAYYGTYNDYVVFIAPWPMTALGEIHIGNYTFWYSTLFDLRAYKDGEFYELKDLYKEGLIDDVLLKAIYEAHLKHDKEVSEFYKKQNNE